VKFKQNVKANEVNVKCYFGQEVAREVMLLIKSDVNPEHTLEKIDRLLGGFGVESILRAGRVGMYMRDYLTYVNQGDAYLPTVAHDGHMWLVLKNGWGGYVEEHEKEFA
jgi:hypothetical protein